MSGGTTIQLIGVEFLSTDDLRCKFRDGVVHADYYLKERGVVQCRRCAALPFDTGVHPARSPMVQLSSTAQTWAAVLSVPHYHCGSCC